MVKGVFGEKVPLPPWRQGKTVEPEEQPEEQPAKQPEEQPKEQAEVQPDWQAEVQADVMVGQFCCHHICADGEVISMTSFNQVGVLREDVLREM